MLQEVDGIKEHTLTRFENTNPVKVTGILMLLILNTRVILEGLSSLFKRDLVGVPSLLSLHLR